ncbi:MAG: zinc metallopeptidase [Oscillospiraceae bacterium]
MPYFYFDSYYLFLVVPALLIAMWAQFNVQSAFHKYNRISNSRGLTADQAARQILDDNGLYQVSIERVPGKLSDHYDPKANVIRLSDSTYGSMSVGAIGVAAHEAGHAVQYATGYFPIKIRSVLIPITQIGSSIAIPLAIFGIVFSFYPLVTIGILLFCAVVLFQLITLPVEFNASRRALKTLDESHMLEGEELTGAKRVLRAAALTYVAGLLVAVANLVRLIALSNRRR